MLTNIINQAAHNRSLNILCHATHERYQGLLSKVGHTFWLADHPHFKRWIDKYYPLPQNFRFLPVRSDGTSYLPDWVDIDVVMIESVFGHWNIMMEYVNKLQVPTIRVEHTTTLNWPDEQVRQLRKMSCDLNVFITEDSRKKWLFDETNSVVIDHGVDEEIFNCDFSTKKNHILVVANDFINRGYILGYDIFQRITEGLPFQVVGDTAGLSVPADSVYVLAHFYKSARIFLNCTRLSPQPYSMLEAASCGCAIVSTATCHIPKYFTHGENALLSNDEGELREHLIFLLENPEEAERLGRNAQKLIREKFSKSRFLDQWRKVFDQAAQLPYTGVYP